MVKDRMYDEVRISASFLRCTPSSPETTGRYGTSRVSDSEHDGSTS